MRRRILHNITVRDTGFDTPCWIWNGEKDKDGYGRVKVGTKYVYAHRAMKGQPKGDDLFLDHLCHTRDCVRPIHLEYVTRSENNLRRRTWRDRNTECRRGHALTPENVYVDKRGYRHCRECRKLTRKNSPHAL